MTETLRTEPPDSPPDSPESRRETGQSGSSAAGAATAIARAGEALRSGGLVIIPTETVYGLAAVAFDETAVGRLFRAKGRDPSKPLAVLVGDPGDIATVAGDLSDAARALIDEFFPGPLTVVVPRSSELPAAVSGGGDTVGVRCPDHDIARAIIREAGAPVAATSANMAGGASPRDLSEVPEELILSAELVVDDGPCPGGVESTVVDAASVPPRVLRSGAIGGRIARWLADRE